MRRVISVRPLAGLGIALLIVAALAAASILSPSVLNIARAQSTDPVPGILLPPPVPGLDYTPVDAGKAGPAEGAVIPATPTAPVFPADASTVFDAPDNGGSLTTSLGGSDIAVSSVGGSYEVDRPKKRSHRKK